MGKILMLISLMAGMASWVAAGTEAGAERIVIEHRLAVLEWEKRVAAAESLEAKAVLLKEVPDGKAYGQRMIEEVGKDFTEDWAVKYAAWLLRVHPGLTLADVKLLVDYMEKYHRGSEDLGQFAIALVGAGEGDAGNAAALTAMKIQFLEGVLGGKGDDGTVAGKRDRGEAALALSMMLGKMGQGANVNEQRLALLRRAIIAAADSKVGETTVAEMAQEELYRLTKLTKGREAPDLAGVDAKGQVMKLSDFRGKVVMLVFWSSWERGAEVLQYLKKSAKAHAGKPFQIVGVNRDTAANLRDLAQLGKLTGRHFSDADERLFAIYRVKATPYCFVLDEEGKIQYAGALGSFADLTVDAILAE